MVASLGLVLSLCACRVDAYVLAPGTEHGWVTIEEGNTSCPAQPAAFLYVAFQVPRSREACTSTATYDGWHFVRYYLTHDDGHSSRLKLDDMIHNPEFFAVGQMGTRCFFSGTHFFFGTAEELETTPPAAFSLEYKTSHHPECL